jgi:hypothetical protein
VLIVSLRPLGHKACRDGRSVSYQRVPRLSDALALARGDGRHGDRSRPWHASSF